LTSAANGNYQQALTHLVKGVQHHPQANIGPSMRLAIAVCCFKLGQYDRARAALEKSISMDVRVLCYKLFVFVFVPHYITRP
jgi:Flp pilus assembly protein TadD